MSTALGMIIADKMDVAEVHKALDEYCQGLVPDTPCPPDDVRFGKYAAARDNQG